MLPYAADKTYITAICYTYVYADKISLLGRVMTRKNDLTITNNMRLLERSSSAALERLACFSCAQRAKVILNRA